MYSPVTRFAPSALERRPLDPLDRDITFRDPLFSRSIFAAGLHGVPTLRLCPLVRSLPRTSRNSRLLWNPR
jgi:hypothetical protein